MAYLNTKERFGTISIALHWVTVLVFIGLYACVELHEYYPKGSDMRRDLMTWHFYCGYTIFMLVVLRIVARLFGQYPAIEPELLPWQRFLADWMHYALYLLMIAMPIAGFLGLAASGKTQMYFGVELPKLLETNKELAHSIFDIHETIGNIGYFLIGVHTLAALSHHYLQRDNALSRMLFFKSKHN